MTAEKYALECLRALKADANAQDGVFNALGDFLVDAYTIIGQNIPRKLRLERIEKARKLLSARLEIIIGRKDGAQ